MMGSSVSAAPSSYVRLALHAGSWYSNGNDELGQTLETYLDQVPEVSSETRRLRSLICPHAGFSYSGPTAAFAYKALRQELQRPDSPIRTILVLHPAHHVYLPGCAVSQATCLETPVGNLDVDDNLKNEILQKSQFGTMTKNMDEEEHSGEMQYPFLAKIIGDKSIKVLPVMCGALSTQDEIKFGKLLEDIIARPTILTICSSDFCHWGSRFRYQPTGDQGLAIHEFIEGLDRRGMDLIQLQQPGAFADYLKETNNTICGRHPISVWMRGVEHDSTSNLTVSFVRYAQSSAVKSLRESSVSYAAATVYANN